MIARHQLLEAAIGTFQEEKEGYEIAILLVWLLPTVVVTGALFDMACIIIYMKFAHPWVAILAKDKKIKTAPPVQVSHTTNGTIFITGTLFNILIVTIYMKIVQPILALVTKNRNSKKKTTPAQVSEKTISNSVSIEAPAEKSVAPVEPPVEPPIRIIVEALVSQVELPVEIQIEALVPQDEEKVSPLDPKTEAPIVLLPEASTGTPINSPIEASLAPTLNESDAKSIVGEILEDVISNVFEALVFPVEVAVEAPIKTPMSKGGAEASPVEPEIGAPNVILSEAPIETCLDSE